MHRCVHLRRSHTKEQCRCQRELLAGLLLAVAHREHDIVNKLQRYNEGSALCHQAKCWFMVAVRGCVQREVASNAPKGLERCDKFTEGLPFQPCCPQPHNLRPSECVTCACFMQQLVCCVQMSRRSHQDLSHCSAWFGRYPQLLHFPNLSELHNFIVQLYNFIVRSASGRLAVHA